MTVSADAKDAVVLIAPSPTVGSDAPGLMRVALGDLKQLIDGSDVAKDTKIHQMMKGSGTVSFDASPMCDLTGLRPIEYFELRGTAAGADACDQMEAYVLHVRLED